MSRERKVKIARPARFGRAETLPDFATQLGSKLLEINYLLPFCFCIDPDPMGPEPLLYLLAVYIEIHHF